MIGPKSVLGRIVKVETLTKVGGPVAAHPPDKFFRTYEKKAICAVCILDIDVQGVKNIKKTDLQPEYVFIKPPSKAVLEERLRARRTESEESLAKRLAAATAEMDYGDTEGNFDLVIVNDELEAAYSELREFMLPKINFIQEQQQSTNKHS